VQITFWRRAGAGFTGVPITSLHAGPRGDFVDAGLSVTDACGLSNGLTLIATNRRSIFVIDKLKVIHKMEGLEHFLVKLAPLTGSCFVAATNKESIDVFDIERDSMPIAGVALVDGLCVSACKHLCGATMSTDRVR
jgi:hypothetical protein